jgi:hypothetical protein
MSTSRFYFGRLHFTRQLPLDYDYTSDGSREERIRETLWEYVNGETPVYREGEDDDTIWVFSSVDREDGRIFGKFGKVYTRELTEFDFEEWDFIDETESENQAVYSYFVVFPEMNLVGFNRRRRIGYRQFQEAFSEGYNIHIGMEGALSMRLLKDTTDVEEIISNNIIQNVDFDLVPTNPTNEPDMEILDNHIQEMGADEVNLSAESSTDTDAGDTITAEADGGINMDEDLMQAALSMSAAGYGEFRMDYFDENRSDTYNSRERPADKEVEQVNTLERLKRIAPTIRDWALELLDDE